MYYTTINKPRHIKISLLDSCVSFACEYLDLDVDFEIRFEKLGEFQYGLCDYDEDEIAIFVSKSLSECDMIRTIFHEMVHVNQYADGRLESGSPQRWMGSTYDCDYSELPWEIEAFDLEEKMIKAFYG